jgi:hypothetical protein
VVRIGGRIAGPFPADEDRQLDERDAAGAGARNLRALADPRGAQGQGCHFVLFRFVSFCFIFVSFCFVLFRFLSFLFHFASILVHFVSFCFVLLYT